MITVFRIVMDSPDREIQKMGKRVLCSINYNVMDHPVGIKNMYVFTCWFNFSVSKTGKSTSIVGYNGVH